MTPERRRKSLVGHRTLTFGMASLGALVGGFALMPPEARGPGFGFFCAGIGALMAAIAGKSSVEALSGGGGTSGAWAALTTSAKPEAPTTPPAPAATPQP
jgi:hypothetical protein